MRHIKSRMLESRLQLENFPKIKATTKRQEEKAGKGMEALCLRNYKKEYKNKKCYEDCQILLIEYVKVLYDKSKVYSYDTEITKQNTI